MDGNTRKGCFIFEKNVSSLLDQYISLTLDTRIFIHSVYGIIRRIMMQHTTEKK